MGTNGDANAAGVAVCTGIPMRRIEGTRLSINQFPNITICDANHQKK